MASSAALVETLLDQAESSLDTGDAEKALELCNQALKRSPQHPGANFVKGDALRVLGDLEQAADAYRSAALSQPSPALDFVEIHAENFFAEGGAASRLLDQITEHYAVSIHGTAMGLGSASGVNRQYLKKFVQLVNRVDPVLVSDHACFTWGEVAQELTCLKLDTVMSLSLI